MSKRGQMPDWMTNLFGQYCGCGRGINVHAGGVYLLEKNQIFPCSKCPDRLKETDVVPGSLTSISQDHKQQFLVRTCYNNSIKCLMCDIWMGEQTGKRSAQETKITSKNSKKQKRMPNEAKANKILNAHSNVESESEAEHDDECHEADEEMNTEVDLEKKKENEKDIVEEKDEEKDDGQDVDNHGESEKDYDQRPNAKQAPRNSTKQVKNAKCAKRGKSDYGSAPTTAPMDADSDDET